MANEYISKYYYISSVIICGQKQEILPFYVENTPLICNQIAAITAATMKNVEKKRMFLAFEFLEWTV